MNQQTTKNLTELLGLREELQQAIKVNQDKLEKLTIEDKIRLFPDIDGKISPFIAKSKLVVPIQELDFGRRPVNYLPSFPFGLQLANQTDQSVRHLRTGENITISATIRNLGNADASPTTIEFFIGWDVETTKIFDNQAGDKFSIYSQLPSANEEVAFVGQVSSGSFSTGDIIKFPSGVRQEILRITTRSSEIIQKLETDEEGILIFTNFNQDLFTNDGGGRNVLLGRAPGQFERRVSIRHKPQVTDVTFIGVTYIDIPCESEVKANLVWLVPSLSEVVQNKVEVLAATVYVRVYNFSPEDIPKNFDRLEAMIDRRVLSTTLKAVLN